MSSEHCEDKDMIIPNGTEVNVTYEDLGVGEVIKHGKNVINQDRYLVEFSDGERRWLHWSHIDQPLPNLKEYGTIRLYDKLDVIETEDWTVIKVNGLTQYSGHNIDGRDLLNVLKIKHNYLYVDDPEQFDYIVESMYG